jgi:hypothetical protein
LEAGAETAPFLAFFAFLCFLAFGAEASAEAVGAEAEAEPEADGAAMWEAAKAEAENRPATRAAISLFIVVFLNINMLRKTTILTNHYE